MIPSSHKEIDSSGMNESEYYLVAKPSFIVLAVALEIALGFNWWSATAGHAETTMGIAESVKLYDATVFPKDYQTVDWATAWKSGDVRTGAKLFQARCLACHAIDDSNRDGMSGVGPSLAGVADRLAPQFMAQSIVAPSQNLAEAYQPWTALTADGEVIVGHRVESERADLSLIHI